VVALEVINRLCQPCSEFALAEHWYASTGLEDLLGVPDAEVTKDRLYRTLDQLRNAQEKIENDLKQRFGVLFQLDYDLLLYDLTSTYFEGLAETNELARRGYSRDHRSDCLQVIVALVVTRDGFPRCAPVRRGGRIRKPGTGFAPFRGRGCGTSASSVPDGDPPVSLLLKAASRPGARAHAAPRPVTSGWPSYR
jgi:hypothetical protein